MYLVFYKQREENCYAPCHVTTGTEHANSKIMLSQQRITVHPNLGTLNPKSAEMADNTVVLSPATPPTEGLGGGSLAGCTHRNTQDYYST